MPNQFTICNLQIAMSRRVVAFLVAILCLQSSCKEHKHIGQQEVVVQPTDINAAARDIIRSTLDDELDSNGHLKHFELYHVPSVQYFYRQNNYSLFWSNKGAFAFDSDSLISFIGRVRQYGLFPEDYYQQRLERLKYLLADTARENRLDASKWAETDLLLTSAFVGIVKDIRWGRILPDSTLRKDSVYSGSFFLDKWKTFQLTKNMDSIVAGLEPANPFYDSLKQALHVFLKTAKLKKYIEVAGTDSARLYSLLSQRLQQEDSSIYHTSDTVQLEDSIKQYQRFKKLKEDGRISATLISSLNNHDTHKFYRIAVSLDKYKQQPTLPKQFIWVNIPSYQLQLWDSGQVVLKSKVAVGKPETPTPEITSAITNMVTYPQWTIPYSIVKNEILPGLKKDNRYLTRRGYSLIDKKGNEIKADSINWQLFEDMPFTVIQGSGDDNALGVLKFNFPNKYAVYLHDTNQRYLFARPKRALSHGCVRVEAWEDLAYYILENDSKVSPNAIPMDSLYSLLMFKKKRYLPVRRKLPLFIRYITCEVRDGKLVFYEDIYEQDRKIRDQWALNKQI